MGNFLDTGLSDKTFSNAGGAASDIFNAAGSFLSGDLKADALNLKAKGDLAEGEQYDLAGVLARQNEEYTKASTGIQQAQQQRESTMQIGGQEAAVAGAGFSESGSALDILADSAKQGALAQAALGQQGLITEAGYDEQAKSYDIMSATAKSTAAGEEDIANKTEEASTIAGIGNIAGGLLKGAAAIAAI